MVMSCETLRRSKASTALSRCAGSFVGLAREIPIYEPPRKWIRLTSPMSSGVTCSMSPCMIHSNPSRTPSTSTASSRARMVAAPMTLLMPGAGPPPTRIARVLRSVIVTGSILRRHTRRDPRRRETRVAPPRASRRASGRASCPAGRSSRLLRPCFGPDRRRHAPVRSTRPRLAGARAPRSSRARRACERSLARAPGSRRLGCRNDPTLGAPRCASRCRHCTGCRRPGPDGTDRIAAPPPCIATVARGTAEHESTVLVPLFVVEDEARRVSALTFERLAAEHGVRGASLVGDHHPGRPVRLDDVDALHVDLTELRPLSETCEREQDEHWDGQETVHPEDAYLALDGVHRNAS